MLILQIAFTTATVVALSAGIPQLLKLIRLKSSAEFSLSTWMMWCVTQITSVSYMIMVGDPVLILANSSWCAFYVCMVVLILRYRPESQRRFGFAKLYVRDSFARFEPSRVPTGTDQAINGDINKVY